MKKLISTSLILALLAVAPIAGVHAGDKGKESERAKQESKANEKAEKEKEKAKEKEEKEKEKAEKEKEEAKEKAEKEKEKAEKEAEKAKEKAEKEAEKAKEKVEKVLEKAEKEAEKAKENAEKEAKKAKEELEKAAKKAEEDKKKAEEKAQKEIEKLQVEAKANANANVDYEAKKAAIQQAVQAKKELIDLRIQLKKNPVVTDELKAKYEELTSRLEQLSELQQALEVQKELLDRFYKPGDKKSFEKLGELYQKTGASGLKAFVNGKEVVMDVAPFREKGRALVPVRAVSASLNAEVEWKAETRVVEVVRGDKKIVLYLDSGEAEVNGQKVTLETKPVLKNGRVFLPLRFIGEALNTKVDYEEKGEIIIIEDEEAVDPVVEEEAEADADVEADAEAEAEADADVEADAEAEAEAEANAEAGTEADAEAAAAE
ncbi:copper amine oxidase N-terminal domain-containing protein [Brevibacillus panacihumi]|uniref:Copper amine oxidase N-terminal domain-containing protein n=1 Tax=Brevibacillus panacihumi TaxID=497735 RepID=A0A3M8D6S4_9BACL|nr:copper amine oxidase N-terminal domain-containing protein [Brevibacillus panacihumi]RNB83513.1 copper amine oxidase N-terminal domain-containing protein [Brevibacillus panacihumi]